MAYSIAREIKKPRRLSKPPRLFEFYLCSLVKVTGAGADVVVRMLSYLF